MTLRESFFDDSFFKSSWDDFEKVRENMMRESRDMWKNFEEEFKKMDTSMSSNMLENSSQKTESSSRSSQVSQQVQSQSKDVKEMNSMDSGKGWMMPRKWMMPSMFTSDFAKQLDLFQTKDSEVIRVKDDDDKFEVSLDTSQYRPDELRVNVENGVISVE